MCLAIIKCCDWMEVDSAVLLSQCFACSVLLVSSPWEEMEEPVLTPGC